MSECSNLNAWLRDEPGARLDDCPQCRALQGLGSLYEQAEPRPGFARRTARFVLTQPTLWTRLRAWLPGGEGENPMGHFLRLKSQRQWRQLPLVAGLATLFGAPSLVAGAGAAEPFLGQNAAVFTLTALLLLMAVLPVYFVRSATATVVALRKGRCLEEMLCAGASARQLVDALVLHSLRPVLLLGLPLSLVLCPSWLWAPPGDWRAWLGLWLPLSLSVTLLGSYVALMRRRAWQACSPLALLMVILGVLDWRWLALLTPLVVVLARREAILGVASMLASPRGERPARRRRRRDPRPLPENPIQLREAVRDERSGVPFLTFLLAPVIVLAALLLPMSHLVILTAATGLIYLQAANRTLPAVMEEREQGTWDPLLQSGLEVETFVDGWVQVAIRRVLWALAAVAVPAYFLFTRFPSPGGGIYILFWVWGLGWVARVGALDGLHVSATSRNRREANQNLIYLAGMHVVATVVMATVVAGLAYVFDLKWLEDVEFTTLGCPVLGILAAAAVRQRMVRASVVRELVGDPTRAPEDALVPTVNLTPHIVGLAVLAATGTFVNVSLTAVFRQPKVNATGIWVGMFLLACLPLIPWLPQLRQLTLWAGRLGRRPLGPWVGVVAATGALSLALYQWLCFTLPTLMAIFPAFQWGVQGPRHPASLFAPCAMLLVQWMVAVPQSSSHFPRLRWLPSLLVSLVWFAFVMAASERVTQVRPLRPRLWQAIQSQGPGWQPDWEKPLREWSTERITIEELRQRRDYQGALLEVERYLNVPTVDRARDGFSYRIEVLQAIARDPGDPREARALARLALSLPSCAQRAAAVRDEFFRELLADALDEGGKTIRSRRSVLPNRRWDYLQQPESWWRKYPVRVFNLYCDSKQEQGPYMAQLVTPLLELEKTADEVDRQCQEIIPTILLKAAEKEARSRAGKAGNGL